MMIRYKSVFVLALLALPMVSFAQDTNNADIGQRLNRSSHQFHCNRRRIMRTLRTARLHMLHSTLDSPEESHCQAIEDKVCESILNTDDTLAWMMSSQARLLYPVPL